MKITDEMVEAGAEPLRDMYNREKLPSRQLAELIIEAALAAAPSSDAEPVDTRQIDIDICDAVLQWIVKHDLGQADDEFTVADVTSILDDLWGDGADQPGDPKAAEVVLRRVIKGKP